MLYARNWVELSGDGVEYHFIWVGVAAATANAMCVHKCMWSVDVSNLSGMHE